MKKGIYVFLIPVLLLTIVGIVTLSAKSHKEPKEGGINWMTLDQAVAANNKEPRKIMIDLYTDWCGWCKKLDASTYSDPKVSKYINEHYYAVKFNAETKDPVTFKGATYNFEVVGNRGSNKLAYDLGNLNGRLGYPTIVYLDENFEKLETDPGYKEVPAMLQKVRYYGDNKYKTMNWQQYEQANPAGQ